MSTKMNGLKLQTAQLLLKLIDEFYPPIGKIYFPVDFLNSFVNIGRILRASNTPEYLPYRN